ncbi:hypothetical protein [Dermatobacter hominis]|uniref:hypothetical protein n=1 Tax=Dermatobacter hominis TaxID=2884263 RepID=UPI001D10E184|nr:hypothetical protein [Dermatobacter hominis]UDY34201.1 hypothetical protein LH044_12720 [Dermatobacter hominis]
MAIGAGQVSGTRAPRRPLGPPGQRMLLALLVSLLATIAVCVPLAYQARSARDGGDGGPATASTLPSTTDPTVPPSSAPPATTGSAPVQVLPTTVERTDHLSWASAEAPDDTQPLEGATLRGRVVVQMAPPAVEPPVVKAEFWIDPATATAPENVDDSAPFTLGQDDGAEVAPFDTTTLPDGPHTVAVKAVQADGSTVERSSRFQVDNG